MVSCATTHAHAPDTASLALERAAKNLRGSRLQGRLVARPVRPPVLAEAQACACACALCCRALPERCSGSARVPGPRRGDKAEDGPPSGNPSAANGSRKKRRCAACDKPLSTAEHSLLAHPPGQGALLLRLPKRGILRATVITGTRSSKGSWSSSSRSSSSSSSARQCAHGCRAENNQRMRAMPRPSAAARCRCSPHRAAELPTPAGSPRAQWMWPLFLRTSCAAGLCSCLCACSRTVPVAAARESERHEKLGAAQDTPTPSNRACIVLGWDPTAAAHERLQIATACPLCLQCRLNAVHASPFPG
ncbi:hypothetical protein FB645_005559 [Coemansia sp. IMI 203386]|nr:hypothetical protein FB645_005559 [Coemansia sp. IMI 203386]